MHEIIRKIVYSPKIKRFDVKAPLVASKAKPGHFVVIRNHERGERIPLTIADSNPEEGTITLVFQELGKSTIELGKYEIGDKILDIAGPLGKSLEIKKEGTIVCVAGGVGIAPMYPKAKAYHDLGNRVISLIGSQTKELLFFIEEMKAVSDEIAFSTDDGSYGHHGFITELLGEMIKKETNIAEVIAIGPLPMMKAAADITKPFGIKTIVSLNPIMVDGTGMCGSCRVTVGDEVKFSCVDGPNFDGHLVDFDELISRQKRFLKEEKEALDTYSQGVNCRCQRK